MTGTTFVSSVDIGSVNLLRVHFYLIYTFFLLSFNLTILKNMPEKEHFGIYKKSKLFPEDQLQMEHFTIKDGSR